MQLYQSFPLLGVVGRQGGSCWGRAVQLPWALLADAAARELEGNGAPGAELAALGPVQVNDGGRWEARGSCRL